MCIRLTSNSTTFCTRHEFPFTRCDVFGDQVLVVDRATHKSLHTIHDQFLRLLSTGKVSRNKDDPNKKTRLTGYNLFSILKHVFSISVTIDVIGVNINHYEPKIKVKCRSEQK